MNTDSFGKPAADHSAHPRSASDYLTRPAGQDRTAVYHSARSRAVTYSLGDDLRQTFRSSRAAPPRQSPRSGYQLRAGHRAPSDDGVLSAQIFPFFGRRTPGSGLRPVVGAARGHRDSTWGGQSPSSPKPP